MNEGASTLVRFIERLSTEPALWERMLADPIGTARAEGVTVGPTEVKDLLGIAGATDHELLAVIAAHLQRLAPTTAATLRDACTSYLFPDGVPPEAPRAQPRGRSGSPLGARPEATLVHWQVAALQRLEAYDLSPVQEYLAAEGTLPPTWLEDAVFEFRRYLGMRRVFDRSFPMFSDQVDQVWHTALLFTDLYADLCQAVFGRFEHHDPWDEPKPEQVLELWRRFEGAYRLLYGEPTYLWTIRLPAGTTLVTPLPEPATAPVAGEING
jgi:hypothetical protein